MSEHFINLTRNKAVMGIAGIVTSVAVIVFGVLVLLQPGVVADSIMVFSGITLVMNGVLDLMMLIVNRK